VSIVAGLPPEAKSGQLVCMDVETFGQKKSRLHRPEGTFACLSIRLEHSEDTYQIYDQHDIKKVLSLVKKGTWIFHNSLYDLTQLRRFATIQPRFIWDTMLVDQSMWGGYYDSYSLRSLARRQLGIFMDKEIRNDFETATVMTPEMVEYAAADVDYALQIAVKQQEYRNSIYFNAYINVDEPMIFPVLDMKPIKIDRPEWTRYVGELAMLAKETEARLGINSYSHQQVMLEARKHHINLKNTQGTTLEEFSENEFISDVILARRYRHAVSSYGLKWLNDNLEEDDLVYAACHITGAKTGRQSYSNPSMQNVPQRKLPHYRTLFISKHGKMRVSDITQQEPTILGWESQDPVLLASIEAEEDLHQAVADEVGGDRNTVGKTLNLGMSYGMSPKGVSKRLGISESAGNALVMKYFTRYKGVFSWISQKRQEAYKNGFVTTASHRRMFINPHSRHAENNAINSPIQGGAADFTKVWQRKIWERREEVPYEFMLSVHDEILNDPKPEDMKATGRVEDEAFIEAASVLYPKIKFRKETKTGRTWACKQLKEGADDDEGED